MFEYFNVHWFWLMIGKSDNAGIILFFLFEKETYIVFTYCLMCTCI
uniref:Uncharacterized protein n=1 Tax=Populus trichocarpa TaxID=3694 RepID=A9PCE6_POPTR|nr:unknown [Populus trichocarpa]